MGEVPEWSNGPVLKTGTGATWSRVRIPTSPYFSTFIKTFMGKLSVFNFVSLDGFFAGPHGEIDWFKSITPDKDYDAYIQSQSGSGGALLFGHTTYEMMKSFWPTPAAEESDSRMAEIMNNSLKFVVSKTLSQVHPEGKWKNIKLLNKISADEINKLKKETDIVIIGSGTIISQFTDLGLIDEYQLLIVPVILGEGKSMFSDARNRNLKLLEARSFKNGLVSLRYSLKK